MLLLTGGAPWRLPVAPNKMVPGKRANFLIDGGDSGATIAYNGKLYGIAVNAAGWFNVGPDVEFDLGTRFCITATCS